MQKLHTNFMVDENLVLDKEINESRDCLEIRRLEWQEKEKE